MTALAVIYRYAVFTPKGVTLNIKKGQANRLTFFIFLLSFDFRFPVEQKELEFQSQSFEPRKHFGARLFESFFSGFQTV